MCPHSHIGDTPRPRTPIAEWFFTTRQSVSHCRRCYHGKHQTLSFTPHQKYGHAASMLLFTWLHGVAIWASCHSNLHKDTDNHRQYHWNSTGQRQISVQSTWRISNIHQIFQEKAKSNASHLIHILFGMNYRKEMTVFDACLLNLKLAQSAEPEVES